MSRHDEQPARPRVLSEAELELRWDLHMRLVAALAEVRSGDVHDVARTLLAGCIDLIDEHHEPPSEGRP